MEKDKKSCCEDSFMKDGKVDYNKIKSFMKDKGFDCDQMKSFMKNFSGKSSSQGSQRSPESSCCDPENGGSCCM
jgi:hypothetical protein